MINNKVARITTLSPLLLSLSLSGMQQSNLMQNLRMALERQRIQAANQRWILTIRQNNFDTACNILAKANVLLKDHIITGTVDNADNGFEVSFKLKGTESVLFEKLKGQSWFNANNLQECSEKE